MPDDLTEYEYQNILLDKNHLIRALAVALGCEEDSSLGRLIDAANVMRGAAASDKAEVARLRMALQSVSVAHIEPETEFSRTIKEFSLAALTGSRAGAMN